MKSFSIGESFKQSWQLVKANFWLSVRVSFIALGLSVVANYLNHLGNTDDVWIDKLVFASSALGVSLIVILINIGVFKFCLRLLDGDKPRVKELLSYRNYFWKYIGGNIFVGASIIIVLLIFFALVYILSILFHSTVIVSFGILGFIFAAMIFIRFIFTAPLIIDQNLYPIEAMKKSAELTRGIRMHIFVFFLAAALINIVGAICLGVGLLVSVPVTFLAYIIVYRSLLPLPAVREEPVHIIG